MKRETIKKYTATTLAVMFTALTIYGTSCTAVSNNETKASNSATQTEQTAQEETIKELTEADLEGKTLDELWEEYNYWGDMWTKETANSDKLSNKIRTLMFQRSALQYEYGNKMKLYEETQDKNYKIEAEEIEKTIKQYTENIQQLGQELNLSKKYVELLYKNLTFCSSIINQRKSEQYTSNTESTK